jgi:spermidine synthase
MREFINIEPFYPDSLQSDNYVIFKKMYTNVQDASNVKFNQSLNFMQFPNQISLNTKYITLLHINSNKAMMSNHESETKTNQKFLDSAKGDVLIFGLGIGLIVFPLLQDKDIKSITIIEIDGGLINMISPIIKEKDIYSKVEIINCDAFEYHNLINKNYDTIYFDIWAIIDDNSFDEMEKLDNLYKKNLKEGGWIDSWCSEEKSIIKNNK